MRIRKKRGPTPRTGMQQQIIVPEKLKKVWSIFSRVVKLLLFAIGTAGFAAFIIEETMQVRGFGAYGLQQAKMWHEAADYSNQCVDLLERDRKTLRLLRWFNPLTGHIFLRYADGEEMKLQAQMKRIEYELKQLDRRVSIVEGKLKTNHIELPAERDTKLPVSQPISYPKQIDYQTHDERVEEALTKVVATRTGKKYHRKSCSTIQNREVIEYESREAAEKAGLSPCRRCRP